MPTLRNTLTRRPPRGQPIRFRAQLPAVAPATLPPREATHDFLVPNPRPDLACASESDWDGDNAYRVE